MKERLLSIARELGISLVRITSAAPFADEAEFIRSLEARGLRTPFVKGPVEGRCDPRQLLPGARSLICVAMPYRQPFPRVAGGGRGEISRYAWGRDYHHVLEGRLQELVSRLRTSCPDAGFFVSVDATPLLERAAARRAGLGWIGHNCSLITPEVGSWVFLGVVITTLEIEPDDEIYGEEGYGSGCGGCDLCLRACPTGALLAPGVLDARRCLSYVTQMKGVVPPDLRSLMGRRVWGCDTCQAVCPHNRCRTPGPAEAEYDRDGGGGAAGMASVPAEFVPRREEEVRPELPWLLAIDAATFRAVYGDTALAWRGRRVLQRNALVAIGNAPRAEYLPHLRLALGDRRPEIRIHAAWALGRLAASGLCVPEVAGVIAEALASEADEAVRKELQTALEIAGSVRHPYTP